MIDWHLLLAQVGGTAAVVSAIAWLARSVVSQGLSRDLETHKTKLRSQVDTALEHLRIHDRERTEAFKRLYSFAKEIENETFPMAEDRHLGFDHAMKKLYWSKLQMDQIYFPDRANEALDRFADMHVCMRRHELADVTANEIDVFLGREASDMARELALLARASTKPIRGAAIGTNHMQ